MDNIDPLILKEWLQQHHNRRYRTSHPPKVCTFYNSFGCKKKSTCTFLHLCSDFVDRRCRYGHRCPKSHDLRSKHNFGKFLIHTNITKSKKKGNTFRLIIFIKCLVYSFFLFQLIEILLKHRVDVRKNLDKILDILTEKRSYFTHRNPYER